MEVNKISPEAFEKAMKTLGLMKTEEKSEEIIKAEKEAEIKKAEKDAIEKEYQDTLKKAEDLKAKLEGKVVEGEVKKDEVAKPSVDAELIKSIESKVLAFTDVIGKTIEEKEELKKSIDDLIKNQTQLLAFNAELTERLAKVSKQPMDRKSLSGIGAVERFEKGEKSELEKGFKTLNLNNLKDRAELADITFNAAIKDGKVVDKEFAKATECIELGSLGSIPSEAQKLTRRLKEEHKVIVVKN